MRLVAQLFYCLVMLGAAASTLVAQPSATITLKGIVHADPDTSVRLQYVLVGLYQNDSYVAARMTDAQGHFSFGVLPSATYQLRAFLDEYYEYETAITPAQAQQTIWVPLDNPYGILQDVVGTADSIVVFDPDTYGSYAEPSPDPNETGLRMTVNESTKNNRVQKGREAGQLTAGVISDHNDWATWMESVYEPLRDHAFHWELYPLQRYVVQVVNHRRVPLSNCTVHLRTKDGRVLWETRTDNTGRAELWYQLHQISQTSAQGLVATVVHDGFSKTIQPLLPYAKGINHTFIRTACAASAKVDIAWVVDATLSMKDELDYIQTELVDVINRIEFGQMDLDLQQAAVFYRDNGSPEYVTRHKAFTKDVYALQKFINQQEPGHGIDIPEAVEEALTVALEKLTWREDALTRLLFLVLDAPPHHSPERLLRLHQLLRLAAQKGIKIIPVAASGTKESTEYLLRSFALVTNGYYTFLTDHSGIGNSHAEPTASIYMVEQFNDLLVRLIEQATQSPYCDAVPEPLVEELPRPITSIELEVAPNPAVDVVQVTIPEGIPQILITDINGRLLEQWDDLQASTRQWQVGEYAVGVYFLHYVQEGKQQRKQVVVRGE